MKHSIVIGIRDPASMIDDAAYSLLMRFPEVKIPIDWEHKKHAKKRFVINLVSCNITNQNLILVYDGRWT